MAKRFIGGAAEKRLPVKRGKWLLVDGKGGIGPNSRCMLDTEGSSCCCAFECRDCCTSNSDSCCYARTQDAELIFSYRGSVQVFDGPGGELLNFETVTVMQTGPILVNFGCYTSTGCAAPVHVKDEYPAGTDEFDIAPSKIWTGTQRVGRSGGLVCTCSGWNQCLYPPHWPSLFSGAGVTCSQGFFEWGVGGGSSYTNSGLICSLIARNLTVPEDCISISRDLQDEWQHPTFNTYFRVSEQYSASLIGMRHDSPRAYCNAQCGACLA